MANTCTQICIQVVFAVEGRQSLGLFWWQEGFGAFSCSRSQLGTVIRYIEGQQKHHAKKSFLEEYTGLLEKFGVEYDQRYIFKPIDGRFPDYAAPDGAGDFFGEWLSTKMSRLRRCG